MEQNIRPVYEIAKVENLYGTSIVDSVVNNIKNKTLHIKNTALGLSPVGFGILSGGILQSVYLGVTENRVSVAGPIEVLVRGALIARNLRNRLRLYQQNQE